MLYALKALALYLFKSVKCNYYVSPPVYIYIVITDTLYIDEKTEVQKV